jgi:hypothetical protein
MYLNSTVRRYLLGIEAHHRATRCPDLGHIATFRRAAEIGRQRGMADVEQAAPIELDL